MPNGCLSGSSLLNYFAIRFLIFFLVPGQTGPFWSSALQTVLLEVTLPSRRSHTQHEEESNKEKGRKKKKEGHKEEESDDKGETNEGYGSKSEVTSSVI